MQAADAAYAAAAVGLPTPGTPGTPAPAAAAAAERAWLSSLWAELLSSEQLGHRCVPLDDVHSVFRRRHHLKNTALEVRLPCLAPF